VNFLSCSSFHSSLTIIMETIQTDKICRQLGESIFSRNIVFYNTLDSTNTVAKDLAGKGAPEGTIVLTEEQTGGRGRMGRRWLSPGYMNLLFSVLMRPHMKAENVFALSMAFALATSEAVEKVSKLRPMIKWPNDIYLSGKKLGGMLTEFSVIDNYTEYVIVGLGLNVNWSPGDEETLLYASTSVLAESGTHIDREHLLARLLTGFEEYYRGVLSGRLKAVYKAWNERFLLLNRMVDIQTAEGRISGKAIRIDQTGALIILNAKGKEQRILNGDVSVSGLSEP